MWLRNAFIYDNIDRDFVFGDIFISGSIIESISDRAPMNAESIDMDGMYLLPGFFDCHVHLCSDSGVADPSTIWANSTPSEITLFGVGAAKKLLMCGITTARDVGGWDYHEIGIRNAIASGLIDGPRLLCSGKILSMTSASKSYFRGMYEEADGADMVTRAARLQLAAGADFIKLLATGAVTSSQYERAEVIQLQVEEIEAAVRVARDNGTYVAAHAHANKGILNAINAGCKTIEHASFGDLETYNLMAAKGVWLVPTLCVVPSMFKDNLIANGVPIHIKERYRSIHSDRLANIRKAYGCGVNIVMGTDAGTPGNHCGDNMYELQVMVEQIGMKPSEAIHSATLESARMMGLNNSLGSLVPGKIADIIATKLNPLDDITFLQNVVFVMRSGVIYKNEQ